MEARNFFVIGSSSLTPQDISFIDNFYNAQLHPVIERKFLHIFGVKYNLTFKEIKNCRNQHFRRNSDELSKQQHSSDVESYN